MIGERKQKPQEKLPDRFAAAVRKLREAVDEDIERDVHPTISEIREFVMAQPAAVAAIRIHVTRCPECAEAAKLIRQLHSEASTLLSRWYEGVVAVLNASESQWSDNATALVAAWESLTEADPERRRLRPVGELDLNTWKTEVSSTFTARPESLQGDWGPETQEAAFGFAPSLLPRVPPVPLDHHAFPDGEGHRSRHGTAACWHFDSWIKGKSLVFPVPSSVAAVPLDRIIIVFLLAGQDLRMTVRQGAGPHLDCMLDAPGKPALPNGASGWDFDEVPAPQQSGRYLLLVAYVGKGMFQAAPSGPGTADPVNDAVPEVAYTPGSGPLDFTAGSLKRLRRTLDVVKHVADSAFFASMLHLRRRG